MQVVPFATSAGLSINLALSWSKAVGEIAELNCEYILYNFKSCKPLNPAQTHS